MTTRDPRHDPMPGDVFQTGTGAAYMILDRFVAVDQRGGENPGFFVAERPPGKKVRTGTSSLGVFRNKVRKAVVLRQAAAAAEGWEGVEHHPHDSVTATMRRKHRRPT